MRIVSFNSKVMNTVKKKKTLVGSICESISIKYFKNGLNTARRKWKPSKLGNNYFTVTNVSKLDYK